MGQIHIPPATLTKEVVLAKSLSTSMQHESISHYDGCIPCHVIDAGTWPVPPEPCQGRDILWSSLT